MSDQSSPNPTPIEPKSRPVGATEHSWCKAVPGGTGTTVLSLLFSKPLDFSLLQTSLHQLLKCHPILNSKLRHHPTTNSFSYITQPTPHLEIQFSNPSPSPTPNNSISQFHHILELEININTWRTNNSTPNYTDTEVFFAKAYSLKEDKWALVLRIHTSVCDRTSAVSLLRELLGLMGGSQSEVEEEEEEEEEEEREVGLAIEDYIPSGKGNKPFWARGVDMLGYSLNAFRLTNLDFMDTESERGSQVVRLQLSSEETDQILSGCKSRGIKLCGLMAAAGLIAAHSSSNSAVDQLHKYAVVTLIDCRSILHPVLSCNHPGFYHSAILNTHDIKEGEELWELAKRTYTSFANAKNNQKHFTDMGDINFLMCKAIDNPGLTPYSSLRTSLISVFEDPVIHHSSELHGQIGLEEYIGCASVHGVGPSIAIFDTIRDGALDCACVYPSPLHSREQMQKLVDGMKRTLVTGSNSTEIAS